MEVEVIQKEVECKADGGVMMSLSMRNPVLWQHPHHHERLAAANFPSAD
jgi:hypothetical protein